MDRLYKLNKLGNEAAQLLKEFSNEACMLGENPIKSVVFNAFEKTIIITDSQDSVIEYSLSELSYIFDDGVDGFSTCVDNFEESLEIAKTEAKYEYGKVSKKEFSNYIGSIIYAQYRCEEIFHRIVEIEKETESL